MNKKGSKKRLDKLWAEVITVRAKGKCEYCSRKEGNAHHIIGRRNSAVRWDFDNGIFLCYAHHVFDTRFSAHQTPTIFSRWLEEYKGKGFMTALHNRALPIKRFILEDYLELIDNFTAILKAYSNQK